MVVPDAHTVAIVASHLGMPIGQLRPGRRDPDGESTRINRGPFEGIGTRSEIRAGSRNRSNRITGSMATRRFQAAASTAARVASYSASS